MNLHKIDPRVFDSEIDYFPLYEGLKPSSMGLKKLKSFKEDQSPSNKTFQFGPSFKDFRTSKEICRNERLSKYYQKTNDKYPEIIQYIIMTLVCENFEHFSLISNDTHVLTCSLTNEILTFNKEWELIDQVTHLKIPFVDSFDALAMQISEDLVIHKIPSGQLNPFKSEENKKDYASYIHLSHCNGWTAENAINKTFDEIHKHVPRINQIIPNALRMMASILNQDWRFERIAAISLKTTPYLCRHEEQMSIWDKPFKKNQPYLTIRVERQTVKGFPNSEAFLFTIRTYLYNIDSSASNLPKYIQDKRHHWITETLKNPNPKFYAYELMMSLKDRVLHWIKHLDAKE